jgi:hypothetical protein
MEMTRTNFQVGVGFDTNYDLLDEEGEPINMN